jgi:hypothetical protein
LYTYKASATGKKWIQLGSDTTSLNLVSRFAAKLNISDTASMLTPYFRDADTTLLNLTNRFNTKQNTLISASNIKTINGVNILGSGNIDVSGDGGGGVTTFTGGSTGLTPNTATSGAVTLGGTLAVANGGTGASSFSPNNYLIRTNSSGIFDTSAIYEAGGKVGIGTNTPSSVLNIVGNFASGLQAFEMSRSGVSRDSARFTISNTTNTAGQFLPLFYGVSNFLSTGLAIGFLIIGSPQEDNSEDDVAVRIDGRRKITGGMTTGAIVEFTNLNTPLMRIMASGNVKINNLAGTGSRTVEADVNGVLSAPVSSINYKENVQTLDYGLTELLQINPVSFDYINKDKWGDERNLGFIVEDMFPIIPEVTGTMNNGDMYLDMTKLIPILTKAIQEQNALIKALEQRIINLENK